MAARLPQFLASTNRFGVHRNTSRERLEIEIRSRRTAFQDAPTDSGDGGAGLIRVETLRADVRHTFPIRIGARAAGFERQIASQAVSASEPRPLSDEVHGENGPDRKRNGIGDGDPPVAYRDRDPDGTEPIQMPPQSRIEALKMGFRGAGREPVGQYQLDGHLRGAVAPDARQFGGVQPAAQRRLADVRQSIRRRRGDNDKPELLEGIDKCRAPFAPDRVACRSVIMLEFEPS